MHRALISAGLAALVVAALPAWTAPALAQNQNQNENQVENQNRSENQNQVQNQNQNADDGDNEEGEGTATLTPDEATSITNHACFHAEPDLSGEAFCAEIGGYSMELSDDWDDRISSIEIVGTVKVTVCSDVRYGGTCADFTSTATVLPAELDEAISSWKAE